ncbi:hypothetical protein BIW11_13412, partial [Tropilaelaps mercedesae]
RLILEVCVHLCWYVDILLLRGAVSHGVRVAGSYSEICLSIEDDLNDDLLPGEIQDLNLVQDTTEEITRLVNQINRGDDDNHTGDDVGADCKERHVPTSLPMVDLKVLPTFKTALGQDPDALRPQVREEVEEILEAEEEILEAEEEILEAEEVTEAADEVRQERHEQDRRNSPEAEIAEDQGEVGVQETYVAEDINDLIRQATRNTSLAATSAQDISRLPVIMGELEVDAHRLAKSVQHMMEALSSQLHNVTHLTKQYIGAYENGVTRTCDAADANVKSPEQLFSPSPYSEFQGMYRLLAKYEELSNAMQPVHRLAAEVRLARHLVGQLEALVDVRKHRTS